MLYYLHQLTDWYSPLNVFRYVTFRTLMGAGTAFLITMIIGPWLIRHLRAIKVGQPIRADLPIKAHGKKAGTPTMGGVLIILSVLISSFLWAQPTNIYLCLAVCTMCFMGGVGFVDDYLKVTKKNPKGLSARKRLAAEVLWAGVVVGALYAFPQSRAHVSQLMVPFMKEPVVADLGVVLTLGFIAIVMVGATNAVNLTDGLDGLAIGCSNSAAVAYLVLAYVAGNAVFAKYLQVPYIAGAEELAVFSGCLLGAGLGFLWYNCHPAQVFMGDTGSLALGGSIAMIAIAIKQELLLVIVGGVFVIEAASVILQVGYFKWTKGKRIFRCAPLHHHYEKVEKERAEAEGRDVEVVETLVTIRFWILAIIFALLGVATLKLR